MYQKITNRREAAYNFQTNPILSSKLITNSRREKNEYITVKTNTEYETEWKIQG